MRITRAAAWRFIARGSVKRGRGAATTGDALREPLKWQSLSASVSRQIDGKKMAPHAD
ncbi:hypothetical protein Mal64_20410 [Pseudobythopirellula maris]|uniref:Uncharacterized protein n=1 Tax=Pseudobythopirellula maris TaxID=2527991 RepID=A0A5C5ZNR7_9BACT|nr:hypothetical protein [Pseudobythopirellula maris]TWT88557.1 hypothetical protein Mal64_20410 [Pseudobythopirellula maris]